MIGYDESRFRGVSGRIYAHGKTAHYNAACAVQPMRPQKRANFAPVSESKDAETDQHFEQAQK